MLCTTMPEAKNPAVVWEGWKLYVCLARLVPLTQYVRAQAVGRTPRSSAEHGLEGSYAPQLLLPPEELEQVNYWLDHQGKAAGW